MTSSSAPATPGAGAAHPPYPAALAVSSPSWHSRLAHDNRVPLMYPETYIGLLGANDIVLSDLGVSRLHAVVRWTADGYTIQDLGSRQGTFVQGQRVTGPTPLAPGAHIRIGDADLLFQAVQVNDGAFAQSAQAGVQEEADPAPAWTPDGRQGQGTGEAPRVAEMPAQAVERIAARARGGSGIGAWLATQRDKRYPRVFLIGLAAYLVSLSLLSLGGSPNPHLIPLVMLLASAVVPVSFVVFCWDAGAFADMSTTTLTLAFLGGGVLGIALTVLLDALVGSLGAAPLIIGAVEETGKGLAVLLFLRDRRLRSELDGLIIGAAVGMGFAMIETAGYGLEAFTQGVVQLVVNNANNGSIPLAAVYQQGVQQGVNAMVQELNLRMTLALFGHGVWTAIVGATIWRSRDRAEGRMKDLALAWGIAVLLHALYDTFAAATTSLLPPIIVGVVGLLILRFYIQEAVERAKFGADAPPPPPLARALRNYLTHLSQHIAPRAAASATAFAAAAPGYYAGAEQAAARAFAAFNTGTPPRNTTTHPIPGDVAGSVPGDVAGSVPGDVAGSVPGSAPGSVPGDGAQPDGAPSPARPTDEPEPHAP